jgi:tripartite-type tricarboxylate transporter receptor subunit TctC
MDRCAIISPHYQAYWRHMKRLIAAVALAALGPIAAAQVATAQTYPERSLRGLAGRLPPLCVIARRMSAVLSQSIIIENVTGADGTIGVGRAARAAPDGYQLSGSEFDGENTLHSVQGKLIRLMA